MFSKKKITVILLMYIIYIINSKWKADAKNVRRLKLSHSETKLATAGHTISLWDLAERKVIKVFFFKAFIFINK